MDTTAARALFISTTIHAMGEEANTAASSPIVVLIAASACMGNVDTASALTS